MKLVEKIRINAGKTRKSNKVLINNIYKHYVLFGLLRIKFDLEKYYMEYRFCGIKFMEKTFAYGLSKYSLFKYIKFTTSVSDTQRTLLPILIMYIKLQLKVEQGDIIPIVNRIGESYLTLCHLNNYFINQSISHPIFISVYPHLKTLCNMFSIKVEYM